MISRNAAPGIDRAALSWRKSSYSNGAGGMCVEVARITDGAAVRDSKDPDGPILVFSARPWSTFVGHARAGEFGG
jgi:Domain of unknown function (DUF397)